MPILEIDGVGRVEVGDDFTRLSPEQQQQAVNDIGNHARGGRTEGTISGATGRERMGVGEAFTTGAMRGATMGGLDELHGAARAGAPAQPSGIFDRMTEAMGGAFGIPPEQNQMMAGAGRAIGGDPAAQQQYAAGRDEARETMQRARTDRPIASGIGEVVGGVAAGLALPGGVVATTAPRAVAQGAGLGALYGGAQGFLEGEGGFQQRAMGAGEGAAIGGGIGAGAGVIIHGVGRMARNSQAGRIADEAGVLTEQGREIARQVGLNPDHMNPDAVRAFQAQFARTGAGDEAARAAQLGEFGVQPTRANLTQGVRDFRDQGRAVFEGGAPREAVEAQRAAFGEARDTMARGLANGDELASNANQAAGRVMEGVRERAATARRGVDDAYDAFRGIDANIDPVALRAAPEFVRRTLDRGADQIVLDPVIHTAAGAMLRRIETEVGRIPQDAVEYSIRGAAQLRSSLVELARGSANAADRRATRAVMNAYDDWMEHAVTRAMTSGDEAALTALREANRQHSLFRRTFGPQNQNDDAGKFIQRMVDQGNMTEREAANALLGASRVGETGLSVRLAVRMRDLLGRESPEWNSIRQAVLYRLTSIPDDIAAGGVSALDPGRQAAQIRGFLSGDGRQMARVLFSTDEQLQIARYARAINLTRAPPDAINPSRSGLFAAESGRAALRALMTTFGFSQGGLPGAAAGMAASEVGSNLGRASRASRALTPPRGAVQSPGALPVIQGGQNAIEVYRAQ